MDIRLLENESLLLLYLTGELPRADRDELDAQLAGDAALRSQLDDLRALHAGYESTLEQMDRVDPIVPSAYCRRNVGRAIRQWNIDRLSRPSRIAPPARKVPLWGWSIGSVAAAVLVFCVWWGFKGDTATSHDDAGMVNSQPVDGSANGFPPREVAGNEFRGERNDETQSGLGDAGSGQDSVALSMDPASRRLTVLEQAVWDEMR